MSWEKCKVEQVRKVEIDIERVNSILRMCLIRLRVVQGILLDRETASIVAEDYYEIIKELLTALLLLQGLKSENHECLIAFFKQAYPAKEYETGIIFELKKIRNKISYEGFFIELEYVQRNMVEFRHIIHFLTGSDTPLLCNDY